MIVFKPRSSSIKNTNAYSKPQMKKTSLKSNPIICGGEKQKSAFSRMNYHIKGKRTEIHLWKLISNSFAKIKEINELDLQSQNHLQITLNFVSMFLKKKVSIVLKILLDRLIKRSINDQKQVFLTYYEFSCLLYYFPNIPEFLIVWFLFQCHSY